MRVVGVGLLGLLAVAFVALFVVGPTIIERGANKVMPGRVRAVPAAQQLHDGLFVADMHADSLLWNRDLLERADFAHVDLPRLQEGGVDLQVFAAPTQVPFGINYDRNQLDYDVITALTFVQMWPPRTWFSPTARAEYMAGKLRDFAARSNGKLIVVTSIPELERAVQQQPKVPGTVAALLAIEGLHAMEGSFDNLDRLYAAGYRMMAPTHFFDNDIGGSAHGVDKGGLTDLGRQVIRRLEERNIVVDLAHASPRVIDDVLTIATRPVVVSHTGVKGTCPGPRNLSDEHIRRIAAGGGVIGIGYWDAAVCDVSINGVVAAVRYVRDFVGVQHVGLGSDFDGGTETPFDTSGLAVITEGLMNGGFTESDIRNVMGGNILRLLRTRLPPQ